MIELNKIYCENNLETMARMPDGFVDLVVTSPPYDNLRTYRGYSFEFEKVAKELFRVTKVGGVVVWVVGDATIDGSETGTSFRQALYFKEIGFNLHDTMIYEKSTTPFPMHNRCNQLFEYMFVLSKKAPKTFNPIKIKTLTGGEKKSVDGGYRQKDGSLLVAGYETRKETKTIGNIWRYIVGGENEVNHPAQFSEQLAKDHIYSWSNEGDLVYDPFMGSGTTAIACIETNRRWIGSEISQSYVDLANKRLKPYLTQERLEL